jgi:Ca2+-binding EF-hand superfamily protein
MLCKLSDFEPYASFKRIDWDGTGYLTATKIAKFLKENGYREYNKEDLRLVVRYFDQNSDMRLDYHE